MVQVGLAKARWQQNWLHIISFTYWILARSTGFWVCHCITMIYWIQWTLSCQNAYKSQQIWISSLSVAKPECRCTWMAKMFPRLFELNASENLLQKLLQFLSLEGQWFHVNMLLHRHLVWWQMAAIWLQEIGRASCRERVER